MKILGSDYDGTFSYGGVTDEKLDAVHAWRAAGHRFGIVSGRGMGFLGSLRHYYPALELDFLITCNGGYIMSGDGDVLYAAKCAEMPIDNLIRDLFAWGCLYLGVVRERSLCVVDKKENAPEYVAEENIRLIDDTADIDYFYQISVRMPDSTVAREVAALIREKYGEYVNPLQNAMFIDIVHRDVNKAHGLSFMMEYYGGTHDDVIAVGDNVNDADMLREFRSYAMANGVDEIKALTDATVSDITELFNREM